MVNKVSSLFRKSALTALLAGVLLAFSPTGAMARVMATRAAATEEATMTAALEGTRVAVASTPAPGNSIAVGILPRWRLLSRGQVLRRLWRPLCRPLCLWLLRSRLHLRAPACGYYDSWGYWHAYAGCYVDPITRNDLAHIPR